MKKVLLTSAVALAAFGAVQAVSADGNNGYSSGVVNPLTGKIDQANYSGNTVVSAHTGVVADADQYKPATPVTNPYAVRNRIGKDGKVLPDVFGNGTHVRVHVKDVQGNPVAGVKVAALVYKTPDDFDNYKKPALIEGITDAAGDVEFAVENGGYVLYRVDQAPRGYFVPANLTVGTVLDSEEVVREGSDMFVNGELTIEKTDTYNVVRTEWVKDDNGVWYYYEDNKQVTGWKQIDENWYYLNEKGEMQTGWVNVGGTWYYLNKSGVMQTGWVNVGGTWYFLEASGAMKASQWFQVKDKWYYVNASGALAVNTTVGGYTVNGNGEWVK